MIMTTTTTNSKQLDQLATGPGWSIPSAVPIPTRGKRCHRCHRTSPPPVGCAVCAPERLGEAK